MNLFKNYLNDNEIRLKRIAFLLAKGRRSDCCTGLEDS